MNDSFLFSHNMYIWEYISIHEYDTSIFNLIDDLIHWYVCVSYTCIEVEHVTYKYSPNSLNSILIMFSNNSNIHRIFLNLNSINTKYLLLVTNARNLPDESNFNKCTFL